MDFDLDELLDGEDERVLLLEGEDERVLLLEGEDERVLLLLLELPLEL